MSGEIIIFGAIIAFFIYRFATRKERNAKKKMKRLARQYQREDADVEVSSSMRVILESVEIIKNTKNADTRSSRCQVATDMLKRLLAKYPHRTDWRELLTNIEQLYKQASQNALNSAIAKYTDKAVVARTLATKMSSYTKALDILRDALATGEHDEAWIEQTKEHIEALMHQTEIDTLIEKARLLEFKENWKKALEQYQELLFFIKNDNIPDTRQQEQISFLEDKLTELKAKI